MLQVPLFNGLLPKKAETKKGKEVERKNIFDEDDEDEIPQKNTPPPPVFTSPSPPQLATILDTPPSFNNSKNMFDSDDEDEKNALKQKISYFLFYFIFNYPFPFQFRSCLFIIL